MRQPPCGGSYISMESFPASASLAVSETSIRQRASLSSRHPHALGGDDLLAEGRTPEQRRGLGNG
jgi:hypothetical protein